MLLYNNLEKNPKNVWVVLEIAYNKVNFKGLQMIYIKYTYFTDLFSR